ncbi:peptidyl-prolyl cis-trans isomerase FKBP17-1, chloroplastic isoform X1 [Phalaenopsis equestris]|uniref:peptidyl-prolyl cis-trans isomerase FKBP17-1, chloroplastic isoform X1 n=1 Tax=Phalaenopsis equestris TaxID=78828 RepID=UPI0009E20E05|nr:peptidyl-prolyl cis-trans isomerase FKBP17-1, chloroplastic isoform X1 [Phalaenopsis equestris]
MAVNIFFPTRSAFVSLPPGRKTLIPSTPKLFSNSRRAALISSSAFLFQFSILPSSYASLPPSPPRPLAEFFNIPDSGGVKALDIRLGTGDCPAVGDKVAIHYYGRLAAKQGWRFDSTYDHKDETGDTIPFVFVVGSGKVISGIESAVKTMKVGGIRRVIIPPSQGYQNTSQEPIPPNFFDRQRLYTTIFNPTRLANGEGSTLGTLIFDIELVSLRYE